MNVYVSHMHILRLFSIDAVLILHLNSFTNKASLYVTKTKSLRLKNVTNELNSSLKVWHRNKRRQSHRPLRQQIVSLLTGVKLCLTNA